MFFSRRLGAAAIRRAGRASLRSYDVVIVGAGVAGLSCARTLQAAGLDLLVIDAADGVGGRVRTDVCDGFLLDRGFQVLLTAYPEARRMLDYDRLRLRRFYPGALVRYSGKWRRVADPMRRPFAGALSVFNPIGSLADKLRVGRLRFSGGRRHATGPEKDTLRALREEGFSDAMIERFLRPFLGGVFLETELRTTARKFASVWRRFAAGDIAVPAEGMGRIPEQLAAELPEGALCLGSRVEALGPGGVRLSDGELIAAANVVIATEAGEAARLLDGRLDPPEFNGVSCLYFEAPKPPLREPILALNGDGTGPINNLTVMSEVSACYAPEGKALVSATVLKAWASETPVLERAVRAQFRDWFGEQANAWKLLRHYRIKHAVPFQTSSPLVAPRVRKGVYVCGDHCDVASLDSAMASGRAAAACLLEERAARA